MPGESAEISPNRSVSNGSPDASHAGCSLTASLVGAGRPATRGRCQTREGWTVRHVSPGLAASRYHGSGCEFSSLTTTTM
jgi:hypothetical protein